MAEHPDFVAVVIDPHVHPDVADAYGRFAAIRGVTSDPLFVVLTPHLEPMAAFATTDALDDAASSIAAERDALVAQAGLDIRRYLLANGRPKAAPSAMNLAEIVRSALYDAVGGGVFRGLKGDGTPIFDKLLDDQVQFVLTALDSGAFADEARATLDYVLSDLRDASGAFVAGMRSDSLVPRDGRPQTLEGAHFQWSIAELRQILGLRLADIVAFHYRLTTEGNYVPGYNIFLAPRDIGETSVAFTTAPAEIEKMLADARRRLLAVRSVRPDPRHHTVIVTASNARLISALARAAVRYGDPRYRDEALRAAHALLKQNYKTGQLRRAGNVPAHARDYRAVVTAMLDLYDATFDWSWIEKAIDVRRLSEKQPPSDGVPAFMVGLVAERPETRDTAIVTLAAITNDPKWVEEAGDALAKHPQAFVFGDPSRPDVQSLVSAARTPSGDVFLISSKGLRSRFATRMPYVGEIPLPDDVLAFAVICVERRCGSAITDPAQLAASLGQ